MSHKTGKRVLTASTTLALAAVGLAAAPLAAHAALVVVPTVVDECGSPNDTLLLPPTSTFTRYSVDAAKTIKTLPTATTDADGNKVYKLTDLGALVDADNDAATPRTFTANFNLYGPTDPTATSVAGTATDEVCTVTVGSSADSAPALQVVAPSLPEVAGTVGGELTLEYQKGAQWVVTSDGVTTIYGESAFGTVPVSDKSTKSFTVTGKNTTVTLQPIDSGIVTSPSPLSWTFFRDGLTDIGVPTPAPSQAAGAVTLAAAPADTQWFVTDNTVTDVNMAKIVGVAPATATSDSLRAGETKKYWLVVTDATKAFADGSTYKVYPLTYGVSIIDAAVTDITWADNTGLDNDSFTIPSVEGAKFYYKQAASGSTSATVFATFSAADPLNAANGWKLATEGAPIKVNTATTPIVAVVAVLENGTTYQFATDTGWKAADNTAANSAAGPAYTSRPFTGATIVTAAAPSVNDANLADSDTFTFPAASSGVTYTVTADGQSVAGADAAAIAANTAANLGKTFTRAQWASVFPGLDVATSPTAFVVTATAVGGTFADGSTTQTWNLQATTGAQITVNTPAFSENTGAVSTPDQIKVTKQDGLDYTVGVWADGNTDGIVQKAEIASPIANPTPDASGVMTYSLADGDKVGVFVEAVAPNGIANPDTDVTTKAFSYQFATGKIATPVQPAMNNQMGTQDDTFTLPGATGILYYVDGVAFDMTKINVPQSTGGKLQVTITEKPDTGNGYSFADGATFKNYVLDYSGQALGEVTVDNTIVSDAPPTTTVEWSADGATSYRVTFQKLLSNGQRGPELTWFEDTDATTADFVAMEGDTYYIRVVAMNDEGESDVAETMVEFPGKRGYMDIAPGDPGTFGGSWDHLTNLLAAQDLPYFDDTAALGYNNSSFTVTLPEGSRSFDLYATVHQYGSKGKITVNGVNWADFDTNSAKWGAVTDPYMYPVRSVSGWDPTSAAWKTVTIKVTVVDPDPMHYVALDAYEAR